MNDRILRSRQIIDEMLKLSNELINHNKNIPDEDFKTDMLILIGQHRHTFEEQNVTDHANCITYQIVTGTFEGNTGALMMLANNDPLARACIMHAANFIVKKNLSIPSIPFKTQL